MLVRVRATTVNRTDCHRRAAEPFAWRLIAGLRGPRRQILGSELAGQVGSAAGPAVTEFAVGDPVFGLNPWALGAHAEFVCVRASGLIAHQAGEDFVQVGGPLVFPSTELQVTAQRAWRGRWASDGNDFADLLMEVVSRRASDLHMSAGAHPTIRVRGHLTPLEGYPKLSGTDTREIVYSILTGDQRQRLETDWQIDFAYSVPGHARFRVNAYYQRGAIGAAFRLIPVNLTSIDALGLPATVHEFTRRPRGLVLVTGPTGSGKSTSLAAMIDEINQTRDEHIMTIEDPIEFVHPHKRCLVNQRELGADAQSFAAALKAALRQDPDVILVGEMRDLETISTALTAAETGHLVFATLHTQDTAQTIDRVIDVFPPHQQGQVRVQLSVCPAGGRHPAADPDRGRLGPGGRVRGAGADAGGAQPDPRGQDPPDLLGAADRHGARDADDGRLAGDARARQHDLPEDGRIALVHPR